MKETTTGGEDLGTLLKLNYELTAPLQVNAEIDFKDINIFVGMNGSGKTMVLKLSWAFGTIMSTLCAKTPLRIEEVSQFVFDNTFENQNFNGSIEVVYAKARLKLFFDNGRIYNGEFEIDPVVDRAQPPVFMSTTMRSFTQINQYLKVEALVKSPEQMLTMYRLYDLAFIERLKGRLSGGLKVSDQVKASLKDTFKIEIDIDVVEIENEAVVYKTSKGVTNNLANLSNGEQSLINMVLANG